MKMREKVMTNWTIKLTLISLVIFLHTAASAADVSKQIKKGFQAGNVLGCITRMELYAANAQNLYENPDPDFSKKSIESILKISIPYRDNVMQAAWDLMPTDDWDAFYQLQYQIVASNFDTRNVFSDTFGCVSDLMSIGVIYPKVDPKDMPPEQMEILMQQMQQK